jgi:putative phosphoribosyl transferase
MTLPYRDRTDAGRNLAALLKDFSRLPNVLVLALPRGGVPVAYEVATALDAELDLMIVRKLGFPGQEELAMGAIASGGARVLNLDVVEPSGISEGIIDEITDRELKELHHREKTYRGDRPLPKIIGRTVILVDDGLATGSTMRAALAAVRQQKPAKVVVAVPVAPVRTVQVLQAEADEVVCAAVPESFFGIGQFYEDFNQISDDQVRNILSRAWSETRQPPGSASAGTQ